MPVLAGPFYAFVASYLIFATIWDYMIFASTPDTFTVVGMFLISVAGFLIIADRSF